MTKDSTTQVNRHGVGVWNGPRKVIGFRGDKTLYLAFKPVAKRSFGSVCRALEAFMVAVLGCHNEAVNFGNTVTIDKLNVVRNLRPRRKLEYDPCNVRGCKESGELTVVWEDQEYWMCRRHAEEYMSRHGATVKTEEP